MTKNRKKLIFVIDSIFPNIPGGRETWLYEYGKRLARDYDVEVVSLKGGNKEYYPALKSGMKVHRLPDLRNMAKGAFQGWFDRFTWFVSIEMFFCLLFINIKDGFQETVYVAFDPGYSYHAIARFRKSKRIVTVHGNWSGEMITDLPAGEKRWRGKYIEMEKRGLKDASSVIACSGMTKRRIEKILKRDYNLVINGVNPDSYIPIDYSKREQKSIIFVGALREVKGIEYVVSTIAKLKDRQIKCMVRIVGPGDVESYQEKLNRFGIADYVELLGPRDDVPELLCNSQIALCPYFDPDVPLATLEALAAGCAVITWDNEATRGLLEDGKNALLVPEKNTEAMALALSELLIKTEVAQAIARKGKNVIRDYTFDSQLNTLKGILENGQ